GPGRASGLDSEAPRTPTPGPGAVAGILKTLAMEWPTARCKALDFDGAGSTVDRASRLLEEIATADGEVEVGYRGARRLFLRPVVAPPAVDGEPTLRPGPDWVILLTGGARGITAEVARELAERYRPTLVLVGRSPRPVATESAATAALTTPAEIKAALLDELRRGGRPVTPAMVESATRHLEQEREARRSLEALERAGATVRYAQVDVRDEQAVKRLLDDLYATYGRIDGVIHGAGVIEDRLVEDKTDESFDRVFDTKVDGAVSLARWLRPESLRFFVLFASVAGRFGNRGQADYAAANEALNSLALDLDARWPARVVAVNWGPWAKTGMASAEVQRRFVERGVQVISPAGGRRALVLEIERGRKGEVAVILGDGPWRTDRLRPGAAAERQENLPLLNGARLSAGTGGAVELAHLLDPAQDRYLLDHRLDGHPVFPAAVAMELFAEVVRRGWPEWEVLEIRAFRVLNGIVLENGPRPIKVVARAATQPEQERLEMAVDVAIVDPETRRPCYQATLLLGERLPSPAALPFAPLSGPRPFPMSVAGAYDRWLFQGPLFQGIQSIEGLSEEGISATLVPSVPERCVHGAPAGRWLIDPVVVDSGFQLAILYARAHNDMTPLPARFRSFRRFAPLDGGSIRCEFRARSSAGGHRLETQTAFLGPGGRLLALLEDMELSCSRELNRLAGQAARGVDR
ncbi:MAG TPA: SDR family oxidoreductase, partial [Candidatus Polarisedimenticolia bacterium]|nr:SDR family oxidoreductase [Candidatus Polarisedimenticolia bacterium]